MDLKKVIASNLDDLVNILNFHIYNDIIPGLCITERDYNQIEENKNPEFEIKLADDMVDFRIMEIDNVKSTISAYAASEIVRGIAELSNKTEELVYVSNVNAGFDIFVYNENNANKMVVVYNIVYEQTVQFIINNSNNDEQELSSDYEGDLALAKFLYFLEAEIRATDIEFISIDLVIFREYRDITSKILENDYVVYVNKSVMNILESNNKLINFDNINTYSMYSYISKFSSSETADLYLTRIENIYDIYGSYFNYSGSGRLLLDYKDVILETIKESCNYLFGTYYHLNWHNVSYFKAVGHLLNQSEKQSYIERNTSHYKSKDDTLFKDIASDANGQIDLLNSDEIFKSLTTSEWLINNVGFIEGLDNTYICFGYFKAIEMLLFDVLSHHFSSVLTKSNRGDFYINEKSRFKPDLGTLIYFLRKNIKKDLFGNANLIHKLVNKLDYYRREMRNGFFHKHILDSEYVLQIRKESYELIYMILGITPKLL